MLKFLLECFESGLGYSALNTVRSALSSILRFDGIPVGEHHLVKRFLRGVFNLRPSLPRYSTIWDTTVVLDKLRELSPANSLSLKTLTLKLVLLLALVTHQRVQTLHLLKVEDIVFSGAQVQVKFSELLKQSRPNYHLQPLLLEEFAACKELCVVSYLRIYISKTRVINAHSSRLFVSYKKPHKAVSRDTIARWIRTALAMCGIDTAIFKAHSTRTASSSKSAKFLPIEKVLKAGGWSNDCTFRRFYNKPITQGDSVESLL